MIFTGPEEGKNIFRTYRQQARVYVLKLSRMTVEPTPASDFYERAIKAHKPSISGSNIHLNSPQDTFATRE